MKIVDEPMRILARNCYQPRGFEAPYLDRKARDNFHIQNCVPSSSALSLLHCIILKADYFDSLPCTHFLIALFLSLSAWTSLRDKLRECPIHHIAEFNFYSILTHFLYF